MIRKKIHISGHDNRVPYHRNHETTFITRSRTHSAYSILRILLLCSFVTWISACSRMMDGFPTSDNQSPSKNSNILVINGGEQFCYNCNVTLHASVPESMQMRYSEDGLTWSAWESFSPSRAWRFTYGNGIKTITGEYISENGEITTLSAHITFIDKIYRDSGKTDDMFGASVSISDNTLRVAAGSPGTSVNGNIAQGVVTICDWDGSSWVTTDITDPSGNSGDRFGEYIALSPDGDWLASGSPSAFSSAGKVSVYHFNGSSWILMKTFAGTIAGDKLGSAISLYVGGSSLLRIAAGAPYAYSRIGAVYIWEWNGSGWTTQELSQSSAGLMFGSSVSISRNGTTCASGATGYNTDAGAVYFYDYNPATTPKWNWSRRVTPSSTTAGDFFGNAVSLSANGTILFAGARLKKGSAPLYDDSGAAYIFTISGTSGYTNDTSMYTSVENARLGFSVAMTPSGNTAIAGLPYASFNSTSRRGMIYRYNRLVDLPADPSQTFTAEDATIDSNFGYSVAISPDSSPVTIITGAPYSMSFTTEKKGGVYIFRP